MISKTGLISFRIFKGVSMFTKTSAFKFYLFFIFCLSSRFLSAQDIEAEEEVLIVGSSLSKENKLLEQRFEDSYLGDTPFWAGKYSGATSNGTSLTLHVSPELGFLTYHSQCFAGSSEDAVGKIKSRGNRILFKPKKFFPKLY